VRKLRRLNRHKACRVSKRPRYGNHHPVPHCLAFVLAVDHVPQANGIALVAALAGELANAGDVGCIHFRNPNSGDVQHSLTIHNYSAHARLLFSRSAIFSLLLGKRQQTAGQNSPVAAHLASQNAAIAAELKNPFLGQSKGFGRFGWGANQIKCGLCHSQQFNRCLPAIELGVAA